ncbi:MAG: hypothetical protein WCW02_04120 [Candidatus Buchananbacteria bacterium]
MLKLHMQYSQELKDRIIKYFRQRNGVILTSGQADEYLDSLADLYLCLSQEEK